jgi:hypothetical protein
MAAWDAQFRDNHRQFLPHVFGALCGPCSDWQTQHEPGQPSLSASVRAAVVETAMVGRAIVTKVVAVDQEGGTADKGRRPVEPRVPPPVWLGVGIQGDWLWRQRIDLLRQSGRIHRDLPTAIGLSAGLADGLSRLPFNPDLRGEVAAILKVRLCLDESCVRRVRGSLPDTARQNQHHGDDQKGMRTSISRNEAGLSRAAVGRHSKASIWRHTRRLLFERQRRRTAPRANAGTVWRSTSAFQLIYDSMCPLPQSLSGMAAR